ncbi:recombinase family protein, partial [Candidatus Woesearchaeota archaeon]|nr:recombinase family protein [Candidatus Woesearchaeota archaeon]
MVNNIWDMNGHGRVAGYARVSTDAQLKNYSPEIRTEAYEKDKKRYGWVDLRLMLESGTGTSIIERP